MRTSTYYFLLVLISFLSQNLKGQEEQNQKKIEILQSSKEDVVTHEKSALKLEIEKINKHQ